MSLENEAEAAMLMALHEMAMDKNPAKAQAARIAKEVMPVLLQALKKERHRADFSRENLLNAFPVLTLLQFSNVIAASDIPLSDAPEIIEIMGVATQETFTSSASKGRQRVRSPEYIQKMLRQVQKLNRERERANAS